ncbi:HAMP domain-containing histidine kinase [Adhaeribacter sp. BT258]|uniref:histidine kinase n=1 Tax=Adhaeribacter terrigena TaxID=2793070 RepID=A0ABS1C6G6_9BACT|nr:HAMP domain-containing sensor histidine kinase [Adhaeribacter terrigena]MBK0404940.1 HAMP domain-containing histidine kinase [Adhaeribacter terrigena]
MISTLYNQKARIKLVIVMVALLIGAATVVYTNILVQKVAEREQQLIDIYAKGLRFMVGSETDDNTVFIQEEIIEANKSVPVILTDGEENVMDYKNFRLPENITEEKKAELLRKEIAEMKAQHQPILVEFGEGFKNYIFYKDSTLLTQLRYYPYVQLTVMACFALMAYFAFSYSRKAEQNRVWVGLAKETAHQLGTPLSSLMAWYEYLRSSPKFEHEPIVEELGKDVRRLEIITERFSNIGSVPVVKDENILKVTEKALSYLKSRVSQKVVFSLHADFPSHIPAKVNIPLYEWVVENICKNAIDAMDGKGSIDVNLSLHGKNFIAIDIKDTGKGIPKNMLDNVFMPGYTTKKRGWGLGLALAKRIIENYHSGKLFVKWSEVGKGTTFRIMLPR